jgi:hypothetical protein
MIGEREREREREREVGIIETSIAYTISYSDLELGGRPVIYLGSLRSLQFMSVLSTCGLSKP